LVYSGGRTGSLYLIALDKSDPPIKLGETSLVACGLSGLTEFSPDGSRIGFLSFGESAGIAADIALGVFTVTNRKGEVLYTQPDSTAFWLTDNATYALTLATVATIRHLETAQQTVIPPPEKCGWVHGRLALLENEPYASLAAKCPNPNQWYIHAYRVPQTGAAVLIDTPQLAGGRLYPTTHAHQLLPLPASKGFLWFIPDGRLTNSASMYFLDPVAPKIAESRLSVSVLTQEVPSDSGSRVLFSPDRQQLAFVIRSPQGGDTLYLWSTSQPTADPDQMTDLIRSVTIPGIAWSGDNQRLVYLTGGDRQTLSSINRGEQRPAVNGVYSSIVVNQTGTIAYAVTRAEDETYRVVGIAFSAGSVTALLQNLKSAPLILAVGK
jgi:dipeptidyl aminopeptidase/acylaminoacyl peptidase